MLVADGAGVPFSSIGRAALRNRSDYAGAHSCPAVEVLPQLKWRKQTRLLRFRRQLRAVWTTTTSAHAPMTSSPQPSNSW